MIRQHLPTAIRGEANFRWRGGDVSRIEGLSDAVFALSLTLLVVSLEVPTNFNEMVRAFHQNHIIFCLTHATTTKKKQFFFIFCFVFLSGKTIVGSKTENCSSYWFGYKNARNKITSSGKKNCATHKIRHVNTTGGCKHVGT